MANSQYASASPAAGLIHVPFADELLAWALWYASQGWPVFPCRAGGKEPVRIGGFKSAALTDEFIREVWNGRAMYNIAIPTGFTADVLDVEGIRKPGGDGWAAYYRLMEAGLLAGAHRLVRTPSEGAHVYFAGTGQRCGRLKDWHVDFKSTGGYVLVPPSVVGGRRYELVGMRPPTGVTFGWQAARNLLSPPRPYRAFRHGPGSAKHLVEWYQSEAEAEGNRNSALFWAACRALEAGAEDAVDELAEVALAAGLGEEEVRKTINSAARAVNGG